MSLTADKLRQGASGGASGGGAASSYSIDNSCRFNGGAYLSAPTLGNITSTKWTMSVWFKRSATGTNDTFVSSWNNPYYDLIYFRNDRLSLNIDSYGSSDCLVEPRRLFRDPSAWYHLIVVWDTTLATASDRVKFFVNGVRETDMAETSYPGQNSTTYINYNVTPKIGYWEYNNGNYFNGYMAEFHWLQGIAVTDANDFGEVGSYGEWKPIEYEGSHGSNGYYFNFSTAASLGTDSSGNGNSFTVNSLGSTDQMLDSPTNNFCTLNPLDDTSDAPTISEGNTKVLSGGAFSSVAGTLGASSGKWYWEYQCIDAGQYQWIGAINTDTSAFSSGNVHSYKNTSVWSYSAYSGWKWNGENLWNGTSYGTTWSSGTSHLIGVALDLDNNKIWWSYNGTWQASGNPATGANPAFTTLTSGHYVPSHTGSDTGGVYNFGADSSFAGNKTAQGNGEDGDDFYYEPPTGFKSLKASNLPDPAVIPSEHFNVVAWTGNTTGSTTTNTITGVGFEPSLVWTKVRSHTDNHRLLDQVRGGTKKLASNTTNEELTRDYGKISTWGSDGFTVTGADGYEMNYNNSTYVSWCWKANGAGVSNTDGTTTTTVSADVDAGFSIVSYTGNNTSGSTFGHGLSKEPEMIIIARRDSTNYWLVMHKDITDGYIAHLYGTSIYSEGINFVTLGGATVWTDDSAATYSNQSGGSYIAYCFHSVPGHSKVGSYTGNGIADGTFVQCGFKPKYVMIKASSRTSYWTIFDTERDKTNPENMVILADQSGAEYDAGTNYNMDIVSNGFKLRGSDAYSNGSGHTYIYLAFADVPFKYSNGA